MNLHTVSGSAQAIQPGEAAQQYNEAGRLYLRGEYEKALSTYEKLIASGIANPDLYFNASNAAYRCGDIGHAILYVERTLKLSPSDEDALVNCTYLNSIKQDQETTDQNLFFSLFIRKYESITINTAAKTSLASFALSLLLCSGVLFLVQWKRKSLFVLAGIAGFCFLLSTGIAIQKMNQAEIVNAIVIVDEIPSYSGPGTENTHLFTIHEGTKVTIDRREGEWYLIRLKSGAGGWIRAEGLEEI